MNNDQLKQLLREAVAELDALRVNAERSGLSAVAAGSFLERDDVKEFLTIEPQVIFDVDYPEHAKLAKVKDESQACGEFLEWLTGGKRFVIGRYHEHDDECRARRCGLSPQILRAWPYNLRELLAEYFEIDEDKLELEKRAMLEEIRKKNQERSP